MLAYDREQTLLIKFVNALRTREITSDSPGFRRSLAAIFNKAGIDYQMLEITAVQSLRKSPLCNELLELADDGDLAAICERLQRAEFAAVLDEPLVHALLRKTIIGDLSFERLFTLLRRSCLVAVNNGNVPLLTPRLMVSLACQCFNNEYVYAVSPDEEVALSANEAALRAALDTRAESKLWPQLVVQAMYMPLWQLDRDAQLLSLEMPLDADLGELLDRQVRERAEEVALRATIPSFGMSGDPITAAVREQYEESPYPRWINLTYYQPEDFAAAMQRRFPFLGEVELNHPVRILVAGCGTGQHPLQTATRYPNAQVVAIDISYASLAHAARQARRLGVTNIEFRHGDLLRIADLGMEFDVVESVGVLHCLADPLRGLRSLAAVTRPGGFLNLGLYSTRLRHGLLAAQEFICRSGNDRSPKTLRSLRQEVIRSSRDDSGSPTSSSDFFYLSGFRDLVCHIQELTFTPLEFETLLAAANLTFLGFRGIKAHFKSTYSERFPDDPNMLSLGCLDSFEASHPDLFGGLAQFWVRK